MGETITKILLSGLEIFSDERRRHFSKVLLEKEQAVKDAENRLHPDYTDAGLAKAIEQREIFLAAYETEFTAQIKSLVAVQRA